MRDLTPDDLGVLLSVFAVLLLVFIPGTVAMLCVVILTVETVVSRTSDAWRG
ncbi:hypothetical protein [Gordonia alkanivorans]|uniref:hypothetical protein n=1 Tax=Gordonia alkanivorans TaxID=84096 RepID=UPI0013E2BDE2|nr:hypothetical protein [Gordonia alkanivorans]MDH3009251.1 hypothetical protein [Gordonia alkanivorans]MDH3018146.1 hypothetical protein [Gordonia alkanivorans]MDH3050094.1 hypothetical protein [Gordonia alkanivorans]MDJ0028160.1 hypothetical protein [Gordonia alkanivorans]